MSPLTLLKNFYDVVIKLIKKQTVLYAYVDKADIFNLSDEKNLNFLGIILLSGYEWVPSESDYW